MALSDISIDGRFAVFAIDHRDSLRRFLRPDDPDSLSAQEMTDIKSQLVRLGASGATGVMLESEYSIPQLLNDGSLPEGIGFLAALESQGYLGAPDKEPTKLMEDWSPTKAAAVGAAGCKLLLPYHPDKPLADAQAGVAAEALALCREAGMPLILEPLFYGLDEPADRPRVVLETAERFAAMEPDLLKLPFPIDVTVEQDKRVWAGACAQMDEAIPMPWTVLSGGGDFDSFAQQVEVAVANGASGFMVGRALWGPAAMALPEDREDIMTDVINPRFEKLRNIVGLP